MAEQEQRGQPDEPEFKAGRENWGEPESPYDRDGFVRTEADKENERLGNFAADVVASNMKGRVSDVRELLARSTERYADASDGVATARDLELLREQAERREKERLIKYAVSSNRLGIGEAFGEAAIEAGRHSIDQRNRNWGYATEYESSKADFGDMLHTYEQRRDSTMGQVNELLELNKKGLTDLSVEKFVAVMDKRVALKEKIAETNNLVENCDYVMGDIRRRIQIRKMPYMLSNGQAIFRDSDGVMNTVAELYIDGPNKRWLEIFNSPEDMQSATDSLKMLLEARFDISPKEYLEECAKLAENMKTKAEAAKARLTQSLQELDERIRAGNFAPESPQSGQASEQQPKEGE